MKTFRLIPLILSAFFVLLATGLQAQFEFEEEEKMDKFYMSHSGEMIFSWSNTTHPFSSEGVVIRWAPVFNFQTYANYDFNNVIGVMGGLAMRNIGYIYQFNNADGQGQSFRKKFRTYNLGIPLGIKLGNIEKFFVYGGYEFEFPFHYKEKTFDDDGGKIEKFSTWFSNRTENVQQAVFAGFQTKGGMNIKFKYYLTEFHNQNFSTSTEDRFPPSGDGNRPYAGVESNVFYVSFAVMIDKRSYSYYRSRDAWDFD